MSQEWVYVFDGWFRVDADAGCHDSTTSRHPPLEINAKCELLLQAPRVPSDKEWVLVLTPPPLPTDPPHPPRMGIRIRCHANPQPVLRVAARAPSALECVAAAIVRQ